MNFEPLQNRILVKRIKEEEKTKGGIFIPDSAREKPQRGVVIAVGPGTEDRETLVSPDDMVLFGKYTGSEIELEGEQLIIMRDEDILGVIRE